MAIKENLDKIIEAKLYDEIIKGEWVPGAQIDLNRIIRTYDVSRTPVIHALKKMSQEGLVMCSSKGHYYVPDYNLKQIRDINSMRKLLEIQGMRELRSYGTDINFDYLRELNEQCQYYTDKNRLVESSKYDMVFHRYLVDISGNKCLSDIYGMVQKQFMMVNYMIRRYKKNQQGAACDDHDRIITALQDHNYDKATNILEDHISEAYLKIENRYLEMTREKK
jgi:DNA-binding GntR family transcriptional regulator